MKMRIEIIRRDMGNKIRVYSKEQDTINYFKEQITACFNPGSIYIPDVYLSESQEYGLEMSTFYLHMKEDCIKNKDLAGFFCTIQKNHAITSKDEVDLKIFDYWLYEAKKINTISYRVKLSTFPSLTSPSTLELIYSTLKQTNITRIIPNKVIFELLEILTKKHHLTYYNAPPLTKDKTLRKFEPSIDGMLKHFEKFIEYNQKLPILVFGFTRKAKQEYISNEKQISISALCPNIIDDYGAWHIPKF